MIYQFIFNNMKTILIIIPLVIFNGCYTQVQKNVRSSAQIIPIRDTTVFLPDRNYSTQEFLIKDLYGKWINSSTEENSIIKVYRREDYQSYPPVRFRHEFIFYPDGECEYLILVPYDIPEYLRLRWRLLKEDHNIIYLYNENARREKSLRIELLDQNLLKFIWVN